MRILFEDRRAAEHCLAGGIPLCHGSRCLPVVWWTVFPLSGYPLEALLAQTRECDFAVFVFAPDDRLETRGVAGRSPRDNVLFELGLFVATLGRDRTFIIKSSDADLHVLSDLSGLMMATYSFSRDASKLDKELAPACEKILDRIRPEEFKPRSGRHLLDRDLRLYTFAGQELKPMAVKGCIELRDRSSVFRSTRQLAGRRYHPAVRHSSARKP